MLGYFILTILTSISQAKQLIVPVTEDKFITINDLKDLKIGFLIFVITSLLSLFRWVWGFFSGERKDLVDRVKSVETSQSAVLSDLKSIQIMLAQIKDGQISESEVRNIVRDEASYADKLRRNRTS